MAVVFSAAGLAAAMTASASAAEGAPLGPVVEEVVLVVSDQVVTRSDLELEARLALIRRGGTEAAFAPIEQETVAAALEWLESELLVLAEAERLEVFEVPPEEVADALSALVERFPSPASFRAFLDALDVAPERVAAILRRGIRVARYLESRAGLSVEAGAEEGVGGEEELRYEAQVAQRIEDLRTREEALRLVPPPTFPALEPLRAPMPVEGGPR